MPPLIFTQISACVMQAPNQADVDLFAPQFPKSSDLRLMVTGSPLEFRFERSYRWSLAPVVRLMQGQLARAMGMP